MQTNPGLSIQISKIPSQPTQPIAFRPRTQTTPSIPISLNSSEWKFCFQFLDKRRTGLVSKIELQMIFHRQQIQVSFSDFQQLFASYQYDGKFNYIQFLKSYNTQSGSYNLNQLEFMRSKLRQVLQRNKVSPTMLFLNFDTNKNGFVSSKEIVRYFWNLGIDFKLQAMKELCSYFTQDPQGLNYKQFSEMFLGSQKIQPKEQENFLESLAEVLLSKQADLYQSFLTQDSQNTGILSKEQFNHTFTTLLALISMEDSSLVFDLISKGNNTLLYRSFGIQMAQIDRLQLEQESQKAFDQLFQEFFDQNESVRRNLQSFDGDRDGMVTQNQWLSAMRSEGIEDINLGRVFKKLDIRNTGKLNINQFIRDLQKAIWH